MSNTIEIGDVTVEPAGIEAHPATESVKLFGPPGSGKTTNATARVAMLLRDHGYDINDVTWLTYRKSLAMDTLHRLVDAGVVDNNQLTDPTNGATRYIGTAHAVANRTVSGAGEAIETSDKYRFASEVNIRYKQSEPWEQTPGEQLFRVFGYARKNLLDPTDRGDLRQIPAYNSLKENWNGSVPQLYQDWLDYKGRNDKIMFWEMLAAPLEQNVTPNRPILVIDEYHDAYPLLARLAEYWAEQAEIVIVPGDPHQVVNTYDGADPEFYHRLDYPEVDLPTAWERPPHEHWAVAKSVLSEAHTPPEMDIRNHGQFGVQRSPQFRREADEWRVPAPEKKHSPPWFIEEHGQDVMFLTRTTYQLDALARSLERAGVLFATPSSSDVPGWQAPANDDMSDRVAMYNALQKIRRLSPTAFDSSRHGLDQYDDAESADPTRVVLEPKEAAILLDHAQSKHLDKSRSNITEKASSWLTAEEPVSADYLDMQVTQSFWGVYTDGTAAAKALNKTGKATSSSFDGRDFDALQHALQANRYPVEGEPETKLYTIHASKGNQAQTVVLYDGITSRIKESMKRQESEYRNEWRTWYVALTRSTQTLYVLKGGFDFTSPFLPRGAKLMDLAKRGYNRGGVADD